MPGADLGDHGRSARAVVEADEQVREVLGRHRHVLAFGVGGGGERLDGARRAAANRDRGGEIGQQLGHGQARDELHQIEPVGADVGDGPQLAALVRLEPPVPVRGEEEPVLEVAAVDVPDLADAAVREERPGLLALRVEADVEVRAVDEAAALGELEELGRLRRGHRQRLLTDDVLARRQAGLQLRVVQHVGRGHVHHIDRRIGERLLQALVHVR